MIDETFFNDVLTRTFKKMHRTTCAEATLQGLFELWGLNNKKLTWATAGYGGAISSGKTTCGLLIGCSTAIGFLCGREENKIPEENRKQRNKAIRKVSKLYTDFLKEYGNTECKLLSNTDFSDIEEAKNYVIDKKWKSSCDIYLKFVMEKCIKLMEKEAIKKNN